jgi:hypothetical protein
LVDNSISAGARIVDVDFVWRDDAPHVRILDDGHGMSRDRLISAMRLGSDPRDTRAESDLGRYGLGLKTASLSQATVMTVVSKGHASPPCVARWDLEEIDRAGSWELQVGTPDDLGTDLGPLGDRPSGTMVIWEHLDRLLGPAGSIDAFFAVAESVGRHLGMIYHRLLTAGELAIRLNGTTVPPWSPVEREFAELVEEETSGPLGGATCRAYLVTSPSVLNEEQGRRAAGPLDWIQQQGFYVYRNQRMIVSGGWLGLGQGSKEWRFDPRYNLARLTVDISNADDHEWSVDLRKSVAEPPFALRPVLIRLAQRIRRRSVARARSLVPAGATVGVEGDEPPAIWVAAASTPNAPFRLNRRHPLVAQVRRALSDAGPLRQLLELLERTAPLPPISASPGANLAAAARRAAEEGDVRRLLLTIYPNYRRVLALTREAACERLLGQPHFRDHRSLVLEEVERLEREMQSSL